MQVARIIQVSLGIGLLAALLYTSAIFLERCDRQGRAQRRAEEKARDKAERDLRLLGGTELKITQLYAAPSVIARGQSTRICYGVVNAKEIRFEPPLKDATVSFTKCIDASPAKSVEYKLIATGADGKTVEQTATVDVR